MIQRVITFFQRLGWVQGALYVAVMCYIGSFYVKIWSQPLGWIFVTTVLVLGIGIGSALAPLMFRNYELSHSITSKTGWGLMLLWFLVFNLGFRVNLLGYWGLNVLLWLQLTVNFWIGSHDPYAYELRRLQREMRSRQPADSSAEETPALAEEQDDNWYRRG